MTVVALMAAAAVGAPLRYLLDGFVQERAGGAFPWGTFTVNVAGSFLFGALTGLALYHAFPRVPETVLGAGFCGAFTTFSTSVYESVILAERGCVQAGALNVVGSPLAGLAASAAGLALAALA